jgi:hypothetical protein
MHFSADDASLGLGGLHGDAIRASHFRGCDQKYAAAAGRRAPEGPTPPGLDGGAVSLQTAIYAGAPAANTAFAEVAEVLQALQGERAGG